ncbi:BrnA antitoxin family protein [Microvirga arsenatis]|uniref:BrnA antitoxin family protein n=1 Tax=Microvirga arsenatis TaxID=2692265 RepID=UPI001FE423DE|nr:BrnA antitoxin family protein [Microvirga arsenatis]
MSRSPGGRRPSDPLKAAEAAFKKVTTKPVETPPKASAISGVKESVTLRIDQDVLEYYQQDGPGWQDRINAVLRKAAGK